MLPLPYALQPVTRKLMTSASATMLAGAQYSVANAYPYKPPFATTVASDPTVWD